MKIKAFPCVALFSDISRQNSIYLTDTPNIIKALMYFVADTVIKHENYRNTTNLTLNTHKREAETIKTQTIAKIFHNFAPTTLSAFPGANLR